MRALVVHPGPEQSVADVHTGWVKGLRAVGLEVQEYNLNHRLTFFSEALVEREEGIKPAFAFPDACRVAAEGLQSALYQWWPDLVVVISGFFMNEFLCNLMRARRHKLVLIHTESPYEDDRQVWMSSWADACVVNDPTNLERFREAAPTWYLPHCYDPQIHKPRRARSGWQSDFFFCGTGFDSRIDFFEQVDWSGLDVKLAGNWKPLHASGSPLLPFLVSPVEDCMDNTDTAVYYASTKTSANLYRRESERPELSAGWAIGPREVELAACGTWFARDPRGEGDELFPMLPTFTTPQELGDVIRWGVKHPQSRKDAARKAREAIADRTFDRNAAELLQNLGI